MASTLPASSTGRSPALARRFKSVAVSRTRRTSSGERSSILTKSCPRSIMAFPPHLASRAPEGGVAIASRQSLRAQHCRGPRKFAPQICGVASNLAPGRRLLRPFGARNDDIEFRAMTAARLILLRPPLLEYVFQIRLCDLLKFITHPDGRLADGNDAPDVHRGHDHDEVAIGGRDGLLQLLSLLRPIPPPGHLRAAT